MVPVYTNFLNSLRKFNFPSLKEKRGKAIASSFNMIRIVIINK